MRILGRLISHHAPLILLATLAFALVAGWLGLSVRDELVPYSTQNPASQSSKADDIIADAGGFDPNPGLTVLVQTPDGVSSPQARQRVERVESFLQREENVARVSTAYDRGMRSLAARDGRSTVIIANLAPVSDREQQDAAQHVLDHFEHTEWVDVGGIQTTNILLDHQALEDLVRAELFAFPLVFLLSLLFFRSLVASAIPVLVGGLTIIVTFFTLRVLAELTEISLFAQNLVTGLALGLAIDYSLLFIVRYREERLKADTSVEALVTTLGTAGRTILFSALTISGTLASLLVFPQNFLRSMGLVGIVVPLLAMSISVVVLPALLRVLGRWIDAGAPRWLQRRADRDSRPATSGAWYTVSQVVMRRPVSIALLGIAIMAVLSIPTLGTKFTMADERLLPEASNARVVTDSLRTDFDGVSRAIFVAMRGDSGEATAFADRIRTLPHSSAVPPPERIDTDTWMINVVPDGAELDDSSKDLVRDIRALDSPASFAVGGESARFVDQDETLLDRLPYALLIILVSVLIFIYLLTGSVVLPIKSLAMNVLTVSVAFGALVFVFQHGRLESVLRYDSLGAIDSTQPILITAIILGLSTDYTVFLLSRIKETRDTGVPDRQAISLSVERTGRILSAAALMFCAAVGTFMTADIVLLKQVGLGLLCGVLIDAFLVRALLVPSLMELLGKWNWWAPTPLRWLHARIGISEAGTTATAPAPPAPAQPDPTPPAPTPPAPAQPAPAQAAPAQPAPQSRTQPRRSPRVTVTAAQWSRVLGRTADVVRLLGVVAAVVLAVHMLLTLSNANPDHWITRTFRLLADLAAAGFRDLFVPDSQLLRQLINGAIAACFWLAASSLVARFVRSRSRRVAERARGTVRKPTHTATLGDADQNAA